MSGSAPAWTESVESFTAHADDVRQRLGDQIHRTTPAEYIPDDNLRDAVQAIKNGTSEDGRRMPPWFLPGFGEDPTEEPDLYREKCGRVIPWTCDNDYCGRSAEIGDTCRISRCPRCAASWALKASYNPIASIMRSRYELDQERDQHIKSQHFVVSPRPGELFDAPADATQKEVYETGLETLNNLLGAFDIDDYQTWFHAWRGQDEHDLEPGAEEVADITSQWKHWLFQGEDSESFNSLRNRTLEFSPHFHVIANDDRIPGGQITKALEAATGWVIHRITPNGSNVSLYDEEDVARAVEYCTSHTPIYLDDDGRYRSANRAYGRVKECDPPEWVREWAKDVARKPEVAQTTLGLTPSSLECSGPDRETVAAIRGGPLDDTDADSDGGEGGESEPVTDVVDATTRQARTSPAARTRAREAGPGELGGGPGPWGAPGAITPGEGIPDVDAADVDGEEAPWDRDPSPDSRCGGRMKPAWEMRDKYDSEEWREQAAFADDTLALVAEYSTEVERLEPPDGYDPPD